MKPVPESCFIHTDSQYGQGDDHGVCLFRSQYSTAMCGAVNFGVEWQAPGITQAIAHPEHGSLLLKHSQLHLGSLSRLECRIRAPRTIFAPHSAAPQQRKRDCSSSRTVATHAHTNHTPVVFSLPRPQPCTDNHSDRTTRGRTIRPTISKAKRTQHAIINQCLLRLNQNSQRIITR